MARRKILRAQDRRELFGIPADEDSLIQHYSLSPADRLEIDLRRREHNKLGFAVQLCVMRHPGRVLAAGEILPRSMLKYVADQIGANPTVFETYARREETRRDHIARLKIYLGVRSPTAQDRRAALLSAIEAAAISDSGVSIVNAIVATMRKRGTLLPAVEIIERMGLAARAIARRRAEGALVEGLTPEKLQALDKLLEVDAAVGQTRFHWLRSAPEAPAASNLVGLTDRIAFLRTLGIDPGLRARVASGRWDQMIREGNATPAWLASDFNAMGPAERRRDRPTRTRGMAPLLIRTWACSPRMYLQSRLPGRDAGYRATGRWKKMFGAALRRLLFYRSTDLFAALRSPPKMACRPPRMCAVIKASAHAPSPWRNACTIWAC